jgi:hypothetical protein
MRPALLTILLWLCLGACGDFPQLDAAQDGRGAQDTPRLVPIAGLIAQAGAGQSDAAVQGAVAGRAAGLRARAAAMRGPVYDPVTRARLAAAVAAHPARIAR